MHLFRMRINTLKNQKDKGEKMGELTNYEKLTNAIGERKPFIACDISTTGVMNGNSNTVTQIALVSYDYNRKTEQYELQDKIFMLRRGDKAQLDSIIRSEQPSSYNSAVKCYGDYQYSLVKELKSLEGKLKRLEGKKTATADEKTALEEKIASVTEKIAFFNDMTYDEFCEYKALPGEASRNVIYEGANNYILENLEKKREEIEKSEKLVDILKKQGIDYERYSKAQEGLADHELAIGVSNFLQKYQKKDTVFINNGAYFTKHYLDKIGITIGNKDNTIDLTQAERSMHGGKSEWTASIEKFADNYKKDTGNEIKFFDSLTKALCIGEMTVSACNVTLVNTSEKYLENAVKEQTFSKDEDYVMSRTRALSLDWVPDIDNSYSRADFHFNSLEYVDFGNDRRYVDIDKMFEINDNFEITLEGEKTPIKTWEELEAKIKALNSEISEELLQKIHDKYEEIVKESNEKKETFVKTETPTEEADYNEGYEEELPSVLSNEEEKKEAENAVIEANESIFRKTIEQYQNLESENKATRTELADRKARLLDRFMDRYGNSFRELCEAIEHLNPEPNEYSVKINIDNTELCLKVFNCRISIYSPDDGKPKLSIHSRLEDIDLPFMIHNVNEILDRTYKEISELYVAKVRDQNIEKSKLSDKMKDLELVEKEFDELDR